MAVFRRKRWSMKIIVGIGNPGKRYADTRHNIGFRVVENLAARHRLTSWRRRFHAMAVEGQIGKEKALLMKPDTYVNESGRAVREAVEWCRTPLQEVIIVCDDFNLKLGRLRFRSSGGSGGHNGMESIVSYLATDEVPRLRLGIGGERESSDRDFVLSAFATEEREVAREMVERSARALEVWLESGMERCQNEFNSLPESKKQEKEDNT